MSHDFVIIGAGSVGLPLAYFLSLLGTKVLVLDKNCSPGQGENKAAIGGVRASHSEPVKILAAKRSIEILSELKLDEELEYKRGGYLFGARSESALGSMKTAHKVLNRFGVPSSILKPAELSRAVPGINRSLYCGALFSPRDINISPLKTAYMFYRRARDLGARFEFDRAVTRFRLNGERIQSARTESGEYRGAVFVLANGAGITETGKALGLDVPVYSDSHEAGITAPYRPVLGPMFVDTSADDDRISRTFYFTQNGVGAFIFCYTPYTSLYGEHATSLFGPTIARRMIGAIPSLKNVYVRRTWRGYYPNTPDGVPIADRVRDYKNLYILGGMCGQGVMLGPGLAESFAHFIVQGTSLFPEEHFKALSFYREYKNEELLR